MKENKSQDGTASRYSESSHEKAPSSSSVGKSGGVRQLLRRVSRVVWLTSSAAVLVTGSLVWHFNRRQWETHHHQLGHIKSMNEPWLSRPWVYRPESALPDISGRLYGVAVQHEDQTGRSKLWVAGARGFLAYSDSDGQCWTRYEYVNDRGEFREPKTSPCLNVRQTAQFRWPDLMRSVLAASSEQSTPAKKEQTAVKPRSQQSYPNSAVQFSRSAPGVEVFPTSMDFGDATLPDPKSSAASPYRNLTVTNRASEPARVVFGGFRGDGSSEFQLKPGGCEVELKPGGGNCSTAVILNPRTEGKKLVTLTVQTNLSKIPQSIGIMALVHAQRTGSVPDSGGAPPKADTGSKRIIPAAPTNSALPSKSPPPPPATAPDMLAIQFSPKGILVSTGGLLWDQVEEKAWRFRVAKSGTSAEVGGRRWLLTGSSGDWATETRVKSVADLDLRQDRYQCEDCTIRSEWSDPETHVSWAAGWAAENGRDHGVILRSQDGGKTWEAMTRGALPVGDRAFAATGRPWMWPPPWYLLVLLASLMLALPALLPPPDVQPPSEDAQNGSVEGRLSSDKPLEPGDPDVLGLNAIALGLSRFLRNERTLPPLTVAINGEWGTGKSSLMNLLRCDLKSYGMCPVWFNAWHHQKEEHLLAALLQTVRLEAVPPLWNLLGIPFRVRLLSRWLGRRWAWMVVLAAALIFLVMLDYHLRLHDQSDLFLWITGQFLPSSDGKTSAPLSTVPVQGGIVALLATIAALWKGLTAFGANPASLLASVAQGNKMKDLEAQTSFRQRFAVEFRDFTRALGPRRPLVVFIDDLDRCLPTNVRDVLEAVNFLVSSGDCFVVLGMDRVQVQRAVGLSFKEVAEEAGLKRPTALGNGAQQTADAAGEAARAKRAEFAQKYLEKLINLEVRVPLAIDDTAKRRLFEPTPEKKPEPLLERSLKYGLKTTQWGVPAALALLLLAGAYQLSVIAVPAVERWMDESRVQPPSKVDSPRPPAQALTDSRGKSADVGNTANPGASRVGELPNDSKHPSLGELLSAVPGEPPTISNSKEVWPTRWVLSIPIYLVVVFLLLVANVVLTTRPGVVTHDSQQFTDAMEQVWYPLVLAKQNTPRAAKRFVNRVRYLAMRQRGYQEHASWWERALFPQRLREPVQAEGGQPIPEPLLVAMAAMEQMEPIWIYDPTVFTQLVETTGGLSETLKFPSDNPVAAELLETARANHRKMFSSETYPKLTVDWKFLPTYRNTFLVIWPQIDPAELA